MEGTMVKKMVYLSQEIPDECIKRAQALIVGDASWHIIAPYPYRAHGFITPSLSAPAVTCPVVDIRPVEDEAKLIQVLQTCTDKNAGVVSPTPAS